MASTPTLYQKRLSARRATADIERLGQTYQTGLFNVVQQQQNAFVDWQKESDAKMAPYEAAVRQYTNVSFPSYQAELARYNSTMAAYEQQAAAYRARLNAFQGSLSEVESNPTETVNAPSSETRSGLVYTIDGKQYNERNLPSGYSVNQSQKQVQTIDGKGRPVTTTVTNKTLVRQKSVPRFTEQPPTPPSISMPTAPTPPGAPPRVPAFDDSPFIGKRGELETTFKREVGERKAAKQNVVMRRVNRGMLQGV